MYGYLNHRNKTRKKRALRVRKKLRGTSDRPRLSIHKTNRNIFAQFIDDDSGKTLLSASTIKETGKNHTNKDFGKKIGQVLAKEAKQKKISTVVVDRGRFKYHGVIAELVTSLREAGIQV